MTLTTKRGLSKALLFLLIFSMALSIFACAKDSADRGGNDEKTGAEAESATAGETTEAPPVPKDVTFDGAEIRILNFSYFTQDYVFVNAEEEIGEVVNDAVYQPILKFKTI